MSIIEVILLPMLMGGIGGLGHILVFKNGHFTFPRKFIDDQGEKHYVFGSVKDIIIGVLAGFISVLPVVDTVPVWYIIYISLLSGIGEVPSSREKSNKILQRRRRLIFKSYLIISSN